ncbi:hypothetical protein K6V78_03375 [Streptococcus gallolyticus]|uniref:hypothetical protein n=1 Tax=Streptococcus hepaticus TaxID=3349163 RepID=UPI001C982370|nr:hypothetical protein [Streptococcus gallolyticus]MBY5040738.1 hypothetical protein [Streptococcus gallolyticus]
MLPYPFSYFANSVSAQRIFAGRKGLNFWQGLLTSLFLMALLIFPNTLQIAQLKTYPLDTMVSGIYSPLTREVMEDLKTVTISDGTFSYTGGDHEQVYFNEEAQRHSGFSYQFASTGLTIRNEDKVLAEISYKDLQTEDFQSRKQLTQALSTAWFKANRPSISFLLIGLSSLLLGMNFLFLLFGASGILYLTKRSRLFDFTSFGQCLTFTLNCLGLPTLIASITGLFGMQIANLITIQNVLFVLLLIWVFFKTKFKDQA